MERIAHRGAKRELPENTIEAFVRAIERGADAVELDVHASRDGVIVVHHDPALRLPGDLLRTPIADLDAITIQRVALAPGITIPTLAAVFAALPASTTIYVEVKGTGIESLVAPLVAADRRCVVHSFDHAAIARLRTLAPTVPRGILLERSASGLGAAIAATGARDVWPEWPLINRALVDQVHDAGGRVIAWTVNDRDAVSKLTAMGVDGLCTDDVRIL